VNDLSRARVDFMVVFFCESPAKEHESIMNVKLSVYNDQYQQDENWMLNEDLSGLRQKKNYVFWTST